MNPTQGELEKVGKNYAWWREFPGHPVAKTLQFDCRGPRVQSLVGKLRSRKLRAPAKKEKANKNKVYNSKIMPDE